MNPRSVGRAVLSIYFWAFVVFLFIPLGVLVVFAFNQSMSPTLPITAFTTHWFRQAFSDTELTGALGRSAGIGAATGLVATALGIMASIGLSARRLRLRALIVAVLLLPLVVPYISLAVGLLVLLNQLGLPISLWAVFLGHVVITMPFAVLVVLPRLRSADPSMSSRSPRSWHLRGSRPFLYSYTPVPVRLACCPSSSPSVRSSS